MSDNEEEDIFKNDSDEEDEDEEEEDADADEDDEEKEEDDDDEDDDEEAEAKSLDEQEILVKKKQQQLQQQIISEDTDNDDDDDDMDENYLQKFDSQIKQNYIENYHPECMMHNYLEISALTKIVRDSNNVIVDPLHRTIPFLTKYERARVLGQRAKQINSGAKPFVNAPETVIDGYLLAELELNQKRIPFIIRRPFPGGSGCEYWNLKDLEIL